MIKDDIQEFPGKIGREKQNLYKGLCGCGLRRVLGPTQGTQYLEFLFWLNQLSHRDELLETQKLPLHHRPDSGERGSS